MIKIEKKYYIIPLYEYIDNIGTIQEKVLLKANRLDIENYDDGKTLSILRNVEVISKSKWFKFKRDYYYAVGKYAPYEFRFFKEKLDKLELINITREEDAKLIFEVGNE